MKAHAALAHIRQLCCLGLGGEAIMPALMQAVHDYIPCYQTIFFWIDENGEYTNIYDENIQNNLKVAQLYFKEFLNSREREFWPGSSVLIKSSETLVNFNRYWNRQAMRTDYYNEIVRVMGFRYAIFAKAQEHGRCTGVLGLYRPISDKPYTSQEERNICAIMPYIAHSLHPRADKQTTFADTGEQGLVVMDQTAQVRYFCPNAKKLLFWASHTQFSLQHLPQIQAHSIPPVLPQLCQNLIAIFQGKATQTPALEYDNAWGRFTFRAYWLDPHDHCASALIGITVQRQEPLALTLARQMQHLPLSPKLKDVCLLFAQGKPQRQIAEYLHLSNHTVTDYVRTIYDKLGVHSREGLLKTLKEQLIR